MGYTLVCGEVVPEMGKFAGFWEKYAGLCGNYYLGVGPAVVAGGGWPAVVVGCEGGRRRRVRFRSGRRA